MILSIFKSSNSPYAFNGLVETYSENWFDPDFVLCDSVEDVISYCQKNDLFDYLSCPGKGMEIILYREDKGIIIEIPVIFLVIEYIHMNESDKIKRFIEAFDE